MDKILKLSYGFMERSFDPIETAQFLMKCNFFGYCSWGVSQTRVLKKDNEGYGLLFRVNGHHHKGFVLITLNFLDYFDVRLISTKAVVKDTVEDVFVGDLFNVIDEKVERIPEYKR
jgi:hypothetical protein